MVGAITRDTEGEVKEERERPKENKGSTEDTGSLRWGHLVLRDGCSVLHRCVELTCC